MRTAGRGRLPSVVLPVLCILLWTSHEVPSALAATAAAAIEAALPKGLPPVAEAARAVLTDRDGNGLSDGFQEMLADLPPTATVDVVVTFSGKGSVDAARKAVGPFRVREEFRIIRGFSATVTAAQARALAKVQGVFRVEEDFQVTAMLDASRSDFGIGSVEGWGAGLDGTGVGICVVDTGVDPGHEQLNDGKVAAFVDFVGNRTSAYDDHGHGTHVAAIAAGDGTGGGDAAAFHGAAPRAGVYAAKVLDVNGSGSESDVIAGVQWCAEQPGVHIISMSLGTAGSSDGQDALSQAVDKATSAGRSVVVAAGNSGDGPKSIGSPGAAAKAVTVGAAAEWSAPAAAPNHSNGIYLAPFSSRGPTADGRLKPDIVAPGVSVTSARSGTVSGYATWSGTSMATPFVSGTLALALQINPELTPAGLKTLLLSTARDRGAAGADDDWGAGLLDGAAFIAAAGSLTADPTAFPLGERMTGTVPDNGEKTFSFEITENELEIPLAVAVTILDGGPVCLYGPAVYCDILGTGWAWAPDLDAELIHPSGSVVSESLCPLLSECGAMGRQETLHYLPAKSSDIGTYTVRVYPFEDDADGGKGGAVAVDFSMGPVPDSGSIINSPPVADAGIDQSVTDSDGNGSESVTLDGSGSSDPDGTVDSYVWTEGSTQIATGVAPTVTLEVGTHIITLTITDDDGATASDTVVVAVDAGGAVLTMHIGDLDGTSKVKGKSGKWEAFVALTVHDAEEGPVANAVVRGTWSGDASGTVSGTTDGAGSVTFGTGNLNGAGSVTFAVDEATLASYEYAPGDNHDPDNDSDGTRITVSR